MLALGPIRVIVASGALGLALLLSSCAVTAEDGDPQPPAPDTDQTACLTAGTPWTLDLQRYVDDVAAAEGVTPAPLADVSVTSGSLTIQFTDDFLFAATTSGLTTVRTYDNEGETIVATVTRSDEVSGEWDWFDDVTLVPSRVVYLSESTTSDAVVDGETTVSFFPEPPRLVFGDGAAFTITCESTRLIIDGGGLTAWHFTR
ncbi:hypothetical protein [Microcella sp.]|uniref:hypothetical protein n=1 Tax=Microcella sp. TaxID=1913979 RepID=UPI003F6FFB9B